MSDERTRIPPKYAAPCELCAELLDIRRDGVHQWTAGWVKQRSTGGGHAVACAVRSRRWAHDACVRRASAGMFEQGELL